MREGSLEFVSKDTGITKDESGKKNILQVLQSSSESERGLGESGQQL